METGKAGVCFALTHCFLKELKPVFFQGCWVFILPFGLNCSHGYQHFSKSDGRCSVAFLVALE